MLINRFRRFLFLNAVEGEGGGGGTSVDSTPAPIVEAPAVPAAEPAAAPAPASMLDAIDKGLTEKRTRVADPTAPRDPLGKFVPKVPGEKAEPGSLAAPVAAAPVPAAPAVEPRADDDTAPDGLTPKSQERFQRLVTEKKELATKVDMLDRQVAYVRDTFNSHGVKQDQFEQAASVIGMINKGNYAGAKQILEQQLQQLAVMSGQPVNTIDPLQAFPDLRAQVDGMQMSEQYAMEIARGRAMQHSQQVVQQREQEQFQTQNTERQAVEQGTSAVDAFCKRMLSSDLDYSAIEAQLLPVIPNLLQGVAPQHWARIVETQYKLIKDVTGRARPAAFATTNPLRPTGLASPSQAPKTAFEAMWGQPAPR